MITQSCRPAKFSEVYHQQIAKKVLSAIAREPADKPQTILLSGPYGLGKTTLARIFARALNCEQGKGDACGACRSCTEGNGRNYIEYDSSIVGNVANMRQLSEALHYQIGIGYRVVVLDESQAISRQAQAALLKVTEEVPENVFIVSCTTDASAMSDALRSRHLELELTRAPDEVILDRLHWLEQVYNYVLNEPEKALILSRAGGHFRLCDMMFELAQILRQDFTSTYACAKPLYSRYLICAIRSELTKSEAILKEMLTIPLVSLRVDLEAFFCDVALAVIGGEIPDYIQPVVASMGVKVFSLARFYLAPWGGGCFQTDKTFILLMRSLYKMGQSIAGQSGGSTSRFRV